MFERKVAAIIGDRIFLENPIYVDHIGQVFEVENKDQQPVHCGKTVLLDNEGGLI